jgi:hypothetical protein
MAKEISKEENEKAEKGRAADVKNTLESKIMQEAFAGNSIKSQQWMYGQNGAMGGEFVYNSAMNSKEAQEAKQNMYHEKLIFGKKNGVAGEPSPISNYDLSLQWMQQMNEVLQIAKIGELEKYSTAMGAKLDFKVPEKLKNFNLNDLVKDGEIKAENLSGMQKDAYTLHSVLSEAYRTAVINIALEKGSYFQINQHGKEIVEKYKPKENKPEGQ